jgi:hypothetical protein
MEAARLQSSALEGTMLGCGRPIHLTCVMISKPDERDQVAHAISRRPKFSWFVAGTNVYREC